MKCPDGEIERVGYTRKSFIRKNGTEVKESRVNPTCIEDRGYKGKGPNILPQPDPNYSLRNFGYSIKKTPEERERALKRASNEWGTLSTMRRLNLIANFNKWNPEVEQEMRDDVEFLKNKYAREKAINMNRDTRIIPRSNSRDNLRSNSRSNLRNNLRSNSRNNLRSNSRNNLRSNSRSNSRNNLRSNSRSYSGNN